MVFSNPLGNESCMEPVELILWSKFNVCCSFAFYATILKWNEIEHKPLQIWLKRVGEYPEYIFLYIRNDRDVLKAQRF